jgi:choline/carnitine/betaine transport
MSDQIEAVSAAVEDQRGTMPSVSLGPHFTMHPVVFPVAATTVLALVLATLLFPGEGVQAFFDGVKGWIGTRFGWLYVATMTGLLAFVAWLALSRLGAITLGDDEEEPEFGLLSWFAMLFSAGMGIGLVFWAVAEPAWHFASPPPGVAEGLNPSRVSMAVTIFHWGLHPWALYAAVGLGLAYFGFRKKMPLSFRSFLHPIFGDRVWGRLGDAVDVLAIIATLTGVATSLGIGAQQVNAGLGFLFGLPQGIGVQVALIAAITAIATVSVVMGLNAGIRRLSEINLGLAFILLIMVVVGGGVVAFLGSTVENTGAYLQLLPFNALRTGAGGTQGADWLNAWTVFYWAWWISWSPFVGLFIARISRGRTIRQFVTGVVLVPTLVGIVWLSAFGGATLRQHTQHERLATVAQADTAASELPAFSVIAEGEEAVSEAQLTTLEYVTDPSVNVVTEDGSQNVDTTATALFVLLESMFESKWVAMLAAGVATACIVLFFVTSSDSASMVIDIIASGGNPDPPVLTRLFWAISEGVAAAVLLYAGGLVALQSASIAAALPFTVVLILACVGLTRALLAEPGGRSATERR